MPVSVDIVLPCFNPDSSWPDELLNFQKSAGGHFDLRYIIVNDGSEKGNVTQQVQFLREQQIPVTFLSYEINRGKGFALRHGVKAATSEFVIYTDIDFPFTNDSINAMLHKLTSGNYDIVAGFRNENYYLKKMSPFRKWLSRTFRFFVSRVVRMPVTDTQCGLKGFNGRGRKKFLATHINRYLFDFEFIYIASKDTLINIGTVQVALKDDIVFSKMKGKVLLQETFNLLSILLFRKN
jgi:glycosyltransferase involved in cell wall biosynthesis